MLETRAARGALRVQNRNVDGDVRVRRIGIIHAQIAPNDIIVSIQSRGRK